MPSDGSSYLGLFRSVPFVFVYIWHLQNHVKGTLEQVQASNETF